MSERIRLGVIGLGTWGQEVVAAADGHPDIEVVVAADPAAEARDRLRDQSVPFPVLADPVDVISSRVDAVYIAAPPAAHADLAVAALEAGRHVFCEKPLAISLSDGERIVQAAERTGLVVAVNFALSDRSAVLEVERAIAAGEVGRLRRVDVDLAFPEWPRDFQAGAAWVAGPREGGFVREVFSHFAYLTDRLVGPLELGHHDVQWPADPTLAEASVQALLTAGDGVPVVLTGASGVALPETYDWTLVGERCSYRLTDWGTLSSCEPGGPWQTVELPGERGSEVTRLAAFAAAVRGEPAPHLARVDSAWRVQQVVESLVSAR